MLKCQDWLHSSALSGLEIQIFKKKKEMLILVRKPQSQHQKALPLKSTCEREILVRNPVLPGAHQQRMLLSKPSADFVLNKEQTYSDMSSFRQTGWTVSKGNIGSSSGQSAASVRPQQRSLRCAGHVHSKGGKLICTLQYHKGVHRERTKGSADKHGGRGWRLVKCVKQIFVYLSAEITFQF